MMSHPHHAKVSPKFCKRYAEVGQVIQSALAQYKADVEQHTFPGQQFSPYRIPQHEVQELVQQLQDNDMWDAAEAVQRAVASSSSTAAAATGAAAGQQQHAAPATSSGNASGGPVTVGGSTARSE